MARKPIKQAALSVQTALGQSLQAPTFRHHGMKLPNEFGRPYKPDWTIFIEDPSSGSRTGLVMGDSKLDEKWRSDWMSSDESIPRRQQVMWPYRQIATYCRLAGTRYGFLITPLEFVAVRVSSVPVPGTQSAGTNHRHRGAGFYNAAIEYASIPWDRHEGLTVNMAIWALAMMSIHDQHRAVVPFGTALPITTWVYIGGTQPPPGQMHVLSGNVVYSTSAPASGYASGQGSGGYNRDAVLGAYPAAGPGSSYSANTAYGYGGYYNY